uniref:Eco57I restriction-modification methylase domain-containing protein n=1 Tax=Psychrobacter sp. TaxID=56811 RepID=UPI00159A894F|nr:Eco57I restriction-modification methylase domain-containing protein [Psychrobacter sp.]QJS05465.1 type I restriction-modification system methyltransferase subunit [Psychrobacter sp.]
MHYFQDTKHMLDLIKKSKNHCSYDEVNEKYIEGSIELGRNKYQGVVATPDDIIQFMIELSIKNIDKNINEIRWYDPCSGSGKFPYGILKLAINSLEIVSEADLPEIFFSEISEDGYLATLINIKNILTDSNLCIEKYIKLGRLKGFLGDALEVNTSKTALLSSNNILADVVIGNPPYVRSNFIDKEYKLKLKRLYPEVFNSNEDLYAYFFSNANNILEKDGIVCFISPQSFMRKKSSESFRGFLSKNLHPLSVIDLDENKIFENVSIHSVIICMGKKINNQYIDYYHALDGVDLKNVVNNSMSYKKINRSSISIDGWFFSDVDISYSRTKFLKDFGFKIRSGIRPSIKGAYVYNIGELENLKNEIKRNAVDAKGIKKWCTQQNSKELLFLIEDNSKEHSEAEILLEKYKKKLIGNGTKNNWMSLRSCSYYDEMTKDKIVYPDISKELKFSLDKSKSFVLDGAFFIDTDDLVLLGILNSQLALDYFKARCTSLGNVENKGRLRLKKYFIEQFPLPQSFYSDQMKRSNIIKLVREITECGESIDRLAALNNQVNEFYI